VVVGTIGNDLRMDYTAVGQSTHLAARMEQAAIPGSILLTGATLRLAEGYVQVRALGKLQVKGMSEPVDAYELIGAEAVRTRLQAAATRGSRASSAADSSSSACRRSGPGPASGEGQLVAVVGEPGVGKSRLFYEFARSRPREPWLMLESRSVSYGKATPYLPMIELLKAYFKIGDRDDHRAIREKVQGRLFELDESLRSTVAPVLALLDTPFADAEWDKLDPVQRRQRTFEAVKRLLLREAQVQPLLLVFEDLHWVDSETQAFLDGLVESLPLSRVLVLVNYRPEYRDPWASAPTTRACASTAGKRRHREPARRAARARRRPRAAQAAARRAHRRQSVLPRGEHPRAGRSRRAGRRARRLPAGRIADVGARADHRAAGHRGADRPALARAQAAPAGGDR
jgi:hypothetical protein